MDSDPSHQLMHYDALATASSTAGSKTSKVSSKITATNATAGPRACSKWPMWQNPHLLKIRSNDTTIPLKMGHWKLRHTAGTSYITSGEATSDICGATSIQQQQAQEHQKVHQEPQQQMQQLFQGLAQNGQCGKTKRPLEIISNEITIPLKIVYWKLRYFEGDCNMTLLTAACHLRVMTYKGH